MSYKFTFRSEKITNLDIESLLKTRKNISQPRLMEDIIKVIKKNGSGIASIDSILSAFKGYLIPVNSEVDKNKVMINICIPFLTGTKPVKTNIIPISKSLIQETPLTTK